jgi:hypothetical protein
MALARAVARDHLGPCTSWRAEGLARELALPSPALAICYRILGYTPRQIAAIFDVPVEVVADRLRDMLPPPRSGQYARILD